jgi:hypothetical protein
MAITDSVTVKADKGARLVKQETLQQMSAEVVALVKKASELSGNPDKKFKEKVKTWFGPPAMNEDPDKKKLDTIKEGLGKLLICVTTAKGISFTCKDITTLASADLKSAALDFTLGTGFTWERYSWGEKVCTIIHELTHKAIPTKDVGAYAVDALGGSNVAYGAKCIQLAKVKGDNAKALTNADNWGYFICEFRKEAGVVDAKDPDKWKFFKLLEIEARQAGDGKKPDERILAPVK